MSDFGDGEMTDMLESVLVVGRESSSKGNEMRKGSSTCFGGEGESEKRGQRFPFSSHRSPITRDERYKDSRSCKSSRILLSACCDSWLRSHRAGQPLPAIPFLDVANFGPRSIGWRTLDETVGSLRPATTSDRNETDLGFFFFDLN